MAQTVPRLPLSDGTQIPQVGLGTWQAKPGEVQQAVENGIDVGYRHIDCALAYENEGEVGAAIAKKIQEGVVSRKDLFITTKLPPTMNDPPLVRDGLKASLDLLKLDYVDLYLIHNAVGIERDYLKTLPPGSAMKKPDHPDKFFRKMNFPELWKAMEKLVEEGLAKSIGVSNFNDKQLQQILDNSRIKPSVIQVECHAYFPQEELLQYCKKNKIVFEAYSPIGSPGRWGGNTGDAPVLLEEPILKEIGGKHGKSPAQVLLRYLVQRGIVVLPKSIKKERLQENFDIWNFELAQPDMDKLKDLAKKGSRLLDFAGWKDSPTYPF